MIRDHRESFQARARRDDDTSSVVDGCAEPSVDGMAPRESGVMAWRHRIRRRRARLAPSSVLGFACTNTEFSRVRNRLRHAGLRAQNELCAPLPSWEGFTRALGKRMVPWAPLSFTVLALASMWRCSCPSQGCETENCFLKWKVSTSDVLPTSLPAP